MNSNQTRCRSLAVLAGAAVVGVQAGAQQAAPEGDAPFVRPPSFTVFHGLEPVRRYADGQPDVVPVETVWRFQCGSDTTGRAAQDLAEMAGDHGRQIAEGTTVVNNFSNRGGIDIIFNLAASVPAAAVPAFAAAEAYIESHWTDDSTVTVSVSFANLGGGVLGGTGSTYINSTYSNTRNGLINGMDGDDSLQSSLPSGTTIPVRYNASSSTVTNETRVFVTRANYRATIGASFGSDAVMQFNNQFSWDYDPSNGVPFNQTSLVDVVIHEVGHAMGFTSGVDFRNNDIEMLDLWRFQRTDGAGDYNPDTVAEFSTTPRTADFNNPNDDANSDIIEAEYRMSDGNPWQASHFREGIGAVMDPALASGETFYPDYFREADLAMFDQIGYDRETGCTIQIDTHPASQSPCEGFPISFLCEASGTGVETYQWRKDGVNLSGATNMELFIVVPSAADNGVYDCVVTNTCGSLTSNPATLNVIVSPAVTDHPDSQTVDDGDPVTFTVVATGSNLAYQWQKGVAFIPGATSSSYTIPSASASDADTYSCVVSNACAFAVSNSATLTVNSGPPIPGPFALLYPAPGENDVHPEDTFTWQASSDADRYRIRIWSDSGLTNLVYTQGGINSTSHTIPAGELDRCTAYYWGVLAVNDTGSTESSPYGAGAPFATLLEADMNDDGLLNSNDFVEFLNLYNAGDPAADFNADGLINTNDFIAFLNAYNNGGCSP